MSGHAPVEFALPAWAAPMHLQHSVPPLQLSFTAHVDMVLIGLGSCLLCTRPALLTSAQWLQRILVPASLSTSQPPYPCGPSLTPPMVPVTCHICG
eukprot:7666927-Lingulodinium_polyedra.AAC.1